MLKIDEFKANENVENGRFFNILNVISIKNSKSLKKKKKPWENNNYEVQFMDKFKNMVKKSPKKKTLFFQLFPVLSSVALGRTCSVRFKPVC